MQTETTSNKKIDLDLQYEQILVDNQRSSTPIALLPTIEQMERWLSTAISTLETADIEQITITTDDGKKKNVGSVLSAKQPIELCIKIVSLEESQALNYQYRGKNKATNVLSFESKLPDFIPSNFIGDLAICAVIVENESSEQNKPLMHHWAHLCVHGLLHLLGYDHINNEQAMQMESLEVDILNELGIDDPYQIS